MERPGPSNLDNKKTNEKYNDVSGRKSEFPSFGIWFVDPQY